MKAENLTINSTLHNGAIIALNVPRGRNYLLTVTDVYHSSMGMRLTCRGRRGAHWRVCVTPVEVLAHTFTNRGARRVTVGSCYLMH